MHSWLVYTVAHVDYTKRNHGGAPRSCPYLRVSSAKTAWPCNVSGFLRFFY